MLREQNNFVGLGQASSPFEIFENFKCMKAEKRVQSLEVYESMQFGHACDIMM